MDKDTFMENIMARTKSASVTTNGAAEGISKTEAVRRAIGEGHDKPTVGLNYIRSTFGIEMSPSHFSNIKSSLAGPKKGKRRGRKPGRKPREAATPAVAPAVSATGTTIDVIRS